LLYGGIKGMSEETEVIESEVVEIANVPVVVPVRNKKQTTFYGRRKISSS